MAAASGKSTATPSPRQDGARPLPAGAFMGGEHPLGSQAKRTHSFEERTVSSRTGDAADKTSPVALHKKMMSLLSSLWVTYAVGSFARLGLADVMDDGAADPT